MRPWLCARQQALQKKKFGGMFKKMKGGIYDNKPNLLGDPDKDPHNKLVRLSARTYTSSEFASWVLAMHGRRSWCLVLASGLVVVVVSAAAALLLLRCCCCCRCRCCCICSPLLLRLRDEERQPPFPEAAE